MTLKIAKDDDKPKLDYELSHPPKNREYLVDAHLAVVGMMLSALGGFLLAVLVCLS